MKTTRYYLTTRRKGINLTAAVVADLHDHSYEKVLPVLEGEKPDIIFIPGDLTESLETFDGFSDRHGLRSPDPMPPMAIPRKTV